MSDDLECFLVLFGIKRMLVVLVCPESKADTLSCIARFAAEKSLELESLDATALRPDDVRGEWEIIYIEGQPYSRRKPPAYWPKEESKLIVVTGLDSATDVELLRAFLYVACVCGDCERADLPDDKLPDGSGFVFLADDDFPADRFSAISQYWAEESSILDLRGSSR